MQGSLENINVDAAAGLSPEEIAAATANQPEASVSTEPNPFEGLDFSRAGDVDLGAVDLEAIQRDPNAIRLANTTEGAFDPIQANIDAGLIDPTTGLDAVGLRIVRPEDRINSAARTGVTLGLEEGFGEQVFNPATNSFVNANRPLGVDGPSAAQAGVTPTISNGELSGFDPSQNVTDLSEQGLIDLEQSARANDLRDLSDLLGAKFEDLGPLLAAEAERRGQAELSAEDLADILRKKLASGGGATPEQLAAIKNIADRQIEQSGSDINTQLQSTLEQLREEAGASRGLRFTDTPIFDQAQKVSNEAGRLQAQNISAARGAQSAAELNLPLQQQQIDLQAGQLALQGQTLEQQLAQQAFNNRALLFGETSGFGLDLLGASPSAQEFSLGQQGLDQQQSQFRRARSDAIKARQQQNVLGLITGVAAI